MKKEVVIELTAPKSWKELTEKQLKYVSWLLTREQYSEAEIWTYAFVRLSGLKCAISRKGETVRFKAKSHRFSMDPEEVAWFAKQFSFLTEKIEEITPLHKMAHREHVDSRLRGVSLIHYLAMENYYQAYLFKNNVQNLNKLCACFYSAGKNFNDAETEKRAKRFRWIPFHERYTVFLWYSGLKKVLQKSFPHYFIAFESDETPSAPNMRKQIDVMMRSLNGGDITKNPQIYDTELWTALAELDAKALEYKTLKSKMKN